MAHYAKDAEGEPAVNQSAPDAEPDRHARSGVKERSVDQDQKFGHKSRSLMRIPDMGDHLIAVEHPAGEGYGIAFIHLVADKDAFESGEGAADQQQYAQQVPCIFFGSFLIHDLSFPIVLFIPVYSKPGSRACTDIWRLPRGVKSP